MLFNIKNVSQVNSQTHIGVVLDVKLTFEEHLKNVINNTNKMIGLLRKLSNLLPRQALVTIYKTFIRPHLDYGDVLYDQAFNNSFHAKMESIQYNACLTITGAIRGTSREKIYQELGLESSDFVVGTANFVSFIKFPGQSKSRQNKSFMKLWSRY